TGCALRKSTYPAATTSNPPRSAPSQRIDYSASRTWRLNYSASRTWRLNYSASHTWRLVYSASHTWWRLAGSVIFRAGLLAACLGLERLGEVDPRRTDPEAPEIVELAHRDVVDVGGAVDVR